VRKTKFFHSTTIAAIFDLFCGRRDLIVMTGEIDLHSNSVLQPIDSIKASKWFPLAPVVDELIGWWKASTKLGIQRSSFPFSLTFQPD
jgi:hypothetical protein